LPQRPCNRWKLVPVPRFLPILRVTRLLVNEKCQSDRKSRPVGFSAAVPPRTGFLDTRRSAGVRLLISYDNEGLEGGQIGGEQLEYVLSSQDVYPGVHPWAGSPEHGLPVRTWSLWGPARRYHCAGTGLGNEPTAKSTVNCFRGRCSDRDGSAAGKGAMASTGLRTRGTPDSVGETAAPKRRFGQKKSRRNSRR